MFHDTNKQLFSSVKRLVVIYALVFIQVILILSIPYLIYVSFGMAPIARAAGQPTLSFYDSICIQSFVLFTANLIPLPGASGGAELAFTMYFGSFFNLFYFIVTPFTLCKVGERGRNQDCSVVCNESPHKDCRLDFAYCTDFEEELESEMDNKKPEEKVTQ